MIIRDLELHEATSVHEFLRANGWAHRIGSQDDFSKLITASQRKAVAINPAGHIVGFARGITDGISNGYRNYSPPRQRAVKEPNCVQAKRG